MTGENLLDLITAREAVATTQAEELRAQITALTEQFVVLDTELADLAATRSIFAATGNPLRAKDICVAPAPAPPRRTPKAYEPNSDARVTGPSPWHRRTR